MVIITLISILHPLMDAASFLMMQGAEDDADEVAGEDVDYFVATAAVLTTGAESACLLQNE